MPMPTILCPIFFLNVIHLNSLHLLHSSSKPLRGIPLLFSSRILSRCPSTRHPAGKQYPLLKRSSPNESGLLEQRIETTPKGSFRTPRSAVERVVAILMGCFVLQTVPHSTNVGTPPRDRVLLPSVPHNAQKATVASA